MCWFTGKIITTVVWCVIGCIIYILTRGDMFQRKVSVELNPGLTPPLVLPPGVGLVHVRGLGHSDTLHLLLCNSGAPALLMVNTYSTQSTVHVDWPAFINHSLSGSLRVEPETSVRYSRALVFTKVWEYNDVNNAADPQQMAESSFYPPYELQNFNWSEPKITVNQSDHIVTLCGREKTESFLNGSICLQFSVFEAVGRDQVRPNLRHNANSSQLRVWLDGVTPRGDNSRFALEFQSVVDSGFRERVYVSSFIDDEYKPFFFQVNTDFAEMVEKLKTTRLQAASPAVHHTGSGDVHCDSCTGIKQKAVKSCLECRSSYCQNHLEQHENLFRGKTHNLMDATGRLQEMICPQHDKMLEIYCRTDQQCICMLCLVDEHKSHDTVSTAAERKEKLRKLQEIIQQKEKDLQELREAVESHKRSAQTAVEDSERIFTELIRSIEKHRSEVTQLIRDQERAAVSRAEDQLEQLEKEIDDLRRKDAEQTNDHVHFLKSLQSVSLSGSTDSFTVSFHLSFDDAVKSVSQLRDKLQQFCIEDIKKISTRVKTVQVILTPEYQTREEFLQYFRQLTLDLNSVSNGVHLSERNTVMSYTKIHQGYPDHPDRFDYWCHALCRESLTGRCYWEVEWSSSDEESGVDISVAYKSIRRKGAGEEIDAGRNDQSWRLFCSPDYCSFWHNNIETVLPVTRISSRIGVYVDHSAGILSFYSVSDTMSLIHRVQTTFTQPLYAMFGPYTYSRLKLCRPFYY